MKKIILLSCLLYFTINMIGQVRATPDRLGIGTENPDQRLHVSGGRILLEAGNNSTYYELDTDNSNSDLGILFRDQGTPRSWIYRDGGINALRFSASGSSIRNDIVINGSDGNVGIGTINPQAKLVVGGNSSFWVDIDDPDLIKIGNLGSSNDALRVASLGSLEISIDDNGNSDNKLFRVLNNGSTELFRIEDGGNVGIGTTTPNAKLNVEAANGLATAVPTYAIRALANSATTQNSYGVYSQATGAIGTFSSGPGNYSIYGTTVGSTPSVNNHAGYFDGKVTVTGVFSNPSDRRLKTSIHKIKNGSELLMQLRPVSYTFDQGKHPFMVLPEGKQMGFIAQEMEEILPELVHQNSHPIEKNGKAASNFPYKSINYLGLIPLLTEAFQEQQQQIEKQAQLLNQKEEAIQSLETRLEQLEYLVQQLQLQKAESQQQHELHQKAYLEQNQPNPFLENTTIKYFIPSTAKQAELQIFSIDGKLIEQYNLDIKAASITLENGALPAGNYIYHLIVDGQQIDSKQMMINPQ